jgi:hypothetical protein
MELWLKRSLSGWVAADDATAASMRRFKMGKLVRAEVTTPRNLAHHKKFFALLNLVWSSAGDWPSVEDLLIELKVRLGLYREVVIRASGEIVKVPGSISFAKMDQAEFDKFYDRAVRELCEMAGGIEFDVLKNEVLNQLAAA